jgi:cysteinyl-tRNA synthetase
VSINIQNSLTRKKEAFSPLTPPQVNMYTCGVTVYDDCHIGHARSLYIFDLIRKYLKYRGYTVKFIRNITDIDDKIINRANELKTDWQELVAKYISRYYEDLAALGVEKADVEPRATENIKAMIAHIAGLIELGFAYEAGGDVYFDVRKFSSYGKLSGQSIDQMEAGSRIDLSDLKKDHLDFALWKNSKPGEPSWDSPWGKGRPGWHIECSVMSTKYLQVDTLDIHAGGRDLIFPHHENEVAQAEALTGKPFAKYWIHHGLLTINGQKMSKSLGNFVTIKDFMDKYKNADLLKLFFLTAHYSHPIDYTEEKIEEARKALERIVILMDKIAKLEVKAAIKTDIPEIEALKNKFIEAMDDDFNTPQGLAAVFDLVNLANKHIEDRNFILAAKDTLSELLSILGISLTAKAVTGLDDKSIEGKIAERNRLKAEKKYSEADAVRKELESQGIILEDTKAGTAWRRKI